MDQTRSQRRARLHAADRLPQSRDRLGAASGVDRDCDALRPLARAHRQRVRTAAARMRGGRAATRPAFAARGDGRAGRGRAARTPRRVGERASSRCDARACRRRCRPARGLALREPPQPAGRLPAQTLFDTLVGSRQPARSARGSPGVFSGCVVALAVTGARRQGSEDAAMRYRRDGRMASPQRRAGVGCPGPPARGRPAPPNRGPRFYRVTDRRVPGARPGDNDATGDRSRQRARHLAWPLARDGRPPTTPRRQRGEGAFEPEHLARSQRRRPSCSPPGAGERPPPSTRIWRSGVREPNGGARRISWW